MTVGLALFNAKAGLADEIVRFGPLLREAGATCAADSCELVAVTEDGANATFHASPSAGDPSTFVSDSGLRFILLGGAAPAGGRFLKGHYQYRYEIVRVLVPDSDYGRFDYRYEPATRSFKRFQPGDNVVLADSGRLVRIAKDEVAIRNSQGVLEVWNAPEADRMLRRLEE